MSNRAAHWCYVCQRLVQIRGQDATCPTCGDGFVQEISGMSGTTTSTSAFGLVAPEIDDFIVNRSRMVETMSVLMRQRMAAMGDERELDVHGGHGGAGPVLMFGGGNVPPPHPGFGVLLRGGPRVGIERRRRGGYRTGLEALDEQVLQQRSGRQGPPPASPSAIDAMPVVRISRRRLHAEPHCPVCQDRFEAGEEAREMPCSHLYHAGCIVPWLVQHNSCPVCRHPLPTSPESGGATGSGGASSGESQGRRGSLSFVWPFGSSDMSVYEDSGRFIQWYYNHRNYGHG